MKTHITKKNFQKSIYNLNHIYHSYVSFREGTYNQKIRFPLAVGFALSYSFS